MKDVFIYIVKSNEAKMDMMSRMLDKLANGYTILSAVATHDAVQYILVKEEVKR